MIGSPIFICILIKKNQAILKRSIDLKFGVWFTLGSENEIQLPLSSFLFPFSSFRFPLSSFLFPLSPFPTYLGKIEATVLAG